MNQSMPYAKTLKAQEFLKSEEGRVVYYELKAMCSDDTYNTTSTFSPSAENGVLPFIDKHMGYLCNHRNVNAQQYLSNLRLVTKVTR